MPAVGSVWAADTWDVDAWAADAWAGAVAAAIGDLFTATVIIKQSLLASPSIVQLKSSTEFITQVVAKTVER